MSLDLETVPETAVQGDLLEAAASPLTLSLQDFVSEFGDELLDSLNRANPPVYTGQVRVHRQLIPAALKSGEDRLFSSYQVTRDLKLWIITEWDRSVTTLLLPSEY